MHLSSYGGWLIPRVRFHLLNQSFGRKWAGKVLIHQQISGMLTVEHSGSKYSHFLLLSVICLFSYAGVEDLYHLRISFILRRNIRFVFACSSFLFFSFSYWRIFLWLFYHEITWQVSFYFFFCSFFWFPFRCAGGRVSLPHEDSLCYAWDVCSKILLIESGYTIYCVQLLLKYCVTCFHPLAVVVLRPLPSWFSKFCSLVQLH